jgi:hypothetical protein
MKRAHHPVPTDFRATISTVAPLRGALAKELGPLLPGSYYDCREKSDMMEVGVIAGAEERWIVAQRRQGTSGRWSGRRRLVASTFQTESDLSRFPSIMLTYGYEQSFLESFGRQTCRDSGVASGSKLYFESWCVYTSHSSCNWVPLLELLGYEDLLNIRRTDSPQANREASTR